MNRLTTMLILERQTRQGWGAKVIDRLAADLREAFPEMKGFSSRNLKYMKFFAQMCPAGLIGQQPAAQLPWFHLVTVLTKVSADTDREWYAAQVIQHGWSRPTLDVHIKNQLHLPVRRGRVKLVIGLLVIRDWVIELRVAAHTPWNHCNHGRPSVNGTWLLGIG